MSEGTKPPGEAIPQTVHVTSYPKIIYMWPTWVFSFIVWIISLFYAQAEFVGVGLQSIGWIWIGVMTFNFFVIAFEFSAGKFLVILLVIFAFLIAMFTVPQIQTYINVPNLALNGTFYLTFTIIFTIIFGLLWISRRFNYLEISHQQISYHVGILADERRYPAPSCHFEKITEDVFERVMPPFCAKLVMKTEKGEIAEIMPCVPRINKRLSDIKKILDHLKVIQG